MKFALFLLCLLSGSLAHGSCVILLHGLARSDNSMNKMERRLNEAGFTTINVNYPSRRHEIEILAELAIPPALEECRDEDEINFVTHSLGGILVRQYLHTKQIPKLKRVVMLGPPNQGSAVVDKLKNVPGFNIINGDAGMQLGSNESSIPNTLGPAEFDVGIIAGTRSINLILSILIAGDDDGKVAVEDTRLAGMNDHIVLATTHTFMMNNNDVISQVIHYLHNGVFIRDTR